MSGTIHLVLKREWTLTDLNNDQAAATKIGPGRFEVERIPNPFGHQNADWLVLKGTKIGCAETYWRDWSPGQTLDNPGHANHDKVIDWKDFEVVIEEEG